jgi:hypothetical protein
MATHLRTVEQVIDALGGLGGVSELTGHKRNVVWNWRDREAFPPNTFLVMRSALQIKGAYAPASLWNMLEPEKVSLS